MNGEPTSKKELPIKILIHDERYFQIAMACKTTVLLWFVFLPVHVFAQVFGVKSKLSVTPKGVIPHLFYSIDQESKNGGYFQKQYARKTLFGNGMGIDIELEFVERKSAVFLSYANTNLSLGSKLTFQYLIPAPGTIQWPYFYGGPLRQIKLGYSKNIYSFFFFPVHAQSRLVRAYRHITKNRQPFDRSTYYLTRMKINGIGGVGLDFPKRDYVSPKYYSHPFWIINPQNPPPAPGAYPNPTIQQVGIIHSIYHSPIFNDSPNIAAFCGISFQFFSEKRNNIRIDLFYQHGLNWLLKLHHEYYFEDTPGSFNQYNHTTYTTKGNMLTASLAYPILIKRFYNKQ